MLLPHAFWSFLGVGYFSLNNNNSGCNWWIFNQFFAACSTEIALFIKFFCQIEKKVVGSTQKLRVGRGALNTAIFFFGLSFLDLDGWSKSHIKVKGHRSGVVCVLWMLLVITLFYHYHLSMLVLNGFIHSILCLYVYERMSEQNPNSYRTGNWHWPWVTARSHVQVKETYFIK